METKLIKVTDDLIRRETVTKQEFSRADLERNLEAHNANAAEIQKMLDELNKLK
tara:strand:+ start:245 stop:406 length:162 start_codon:yes stop_codon:yes gene_type:complete